MARLSSDFCSYSEAVRVSESKEMAPFLLTKNNTHQRRQQRLSCGYYLIIRYAQAVAKVTF